MAIISAVGGDRKVKVSSADKLNDFLFGKLSAGSGITLTITSPGGNEKIEIAASASTDHHGGWIKIVSGSSETVVSNKNMVSYGLDIEGQLNVEGYLVLEM